MVVVVVGAAVVVVATAVVVVVVGAGCVVAVVVVVGATVVFAWVLGTEPQPSAGAGMMSPCAAWAGRDASSTVISTKGFFSELVLWQMVVLCGSPGVALAGSIPTPSASNPMKLNIAASFFIYCLSMGGTRRQSHQLPFVD